MYSKHTHTHKDNRNTKFGYEINPKLCDYKGVKCYLSKSERRQRPDTTKKRRKILSSISSLGDFIAIKSKGGREKDIEREALDNKSFSSQYDNHNHHIINKIGETKLYAFGLLHSNELVWLCKKKRLLI